MMKREDPVTCAEYAFKNNILHLSGWRSLRRYLQKGKIMIRALRRVRLAKALSPEGIRMTMAISSKGIKFKFGVRVPRTYKEAMDLDLANGNNLWQEAIQKEIDQICEYNTFKPQPGMKQAPPEYQFIRLHFVFDVKFDGRRKARLVAGGHMTFVPDGEAYSSVVSIKGLRICIFLAELNGLKIMAGDTGNAYLEAYMQEKVYVIAGPEFGRHDHVC